MDEMLDMDDQGFCFDELTSLIKKIKETLDEYEGDPNDYPHINFINEELLACLYSLLDTILSDSDGRIGLAVEQREIFIRMKYDLL